MLQGLPTVLQWLTHSLQTLHCLWIMAKVCVSISVFHTVDFSKTNVIGINNFTICMYWLLLRHKFELVCCHSRVTVIHSPAVQDVYFFGKMSGRGCSHNIVFQPSWPHLPNSSHHLMIIYRQSDMKPFSPFLVLCLEFFYMTLR